MELLIIDKSGWSMPVKIQRATTRVGSASSNDVQLQSPQIAALHLQIFYSPDLPSSCKVVNMSSEVRVKSGQELKPLSTYASLDVHDGDEILLVDYRIKLTLPMTANVLHATKLIDASLSFADAVLRPEYEAVGHLTIKNAGNFPNCQFQVDVDGLPSDCYQIDPIPLMYPGAQEDVRVLIIHHGQTPSAGFQQVIFNITAPESYPGEKCVIQQGIFVSPVFEQALDLIDDVAAAKARIPASVPVDEILNEAPVTAQPVLEAALQQPSAVLTPVSMAPVSMAPVSQAPVSQAPVNDNPPTPARAAETLVARRPIPEPASLGEKSPDLAPVPQPELIAQVFPEKVAVLEQSPNASQPVAQPKPNLKVVHGPGDDFWNEL